MAAFNVIFGCVMALLIILFTISSIARYYIKFTLFVVLSLIFATAPLPLMFLKPFDPKNALIPAALLRLTARVLGIRWQVRGLENVDDSRGAVVLLNHQSCLDLYVLAVLWPLMARCTVVSKRSLQYLVPFGTATWMWGTVFIDRGASSARSVLNKQSQAVKNHKVNVLAVLWPLMARCTVVSKRSLQYLVPFGTATWMWGTVFIDRGASSARSVLNKQSQAVKNHKRKLLLFPEGTRHSGDKLLPFRKGAFHVALDAGAPIQPVVVSKYHFLDSERHRFGSGEIIITILPLIETEGTDKEDISTLVETAQNKMQEEFSRTSAETFQRLPKH